MARKSRKARKRAALDETRIAQVKSAVRPAERVLTYRLAAKRKITVSDLIRDFLLGEFQREGFTLREIVKDDELAD